MLQSNGTKGVDMSGSISLANAKAHLSAVVKEVSSTESEYVITVRGVPMARIVPMPKRQARELRGFGSLKTDKPPMPPDVMHGEWRKAVEREHAATPRH